MRLLEEFGVCDCHSHVYGPFVTFPLARDRSFDAPEAPIEELEAVWQNLGLDRAVLVQGSAHGDDHGAMLAAISARPEYRRGVAVLDGHVTDAELYRLHEQGVRGIRFNWISRLLKNGDRPSKPRITEAARLAERIAPLGWHIELHLDPADLCVSEGLDVPEGMPIVIDHMARIDLAAPDAHTRIRELVRCLQRPNIWVKLSGADRTTENSRDLQQAAALLHQLATAAPDRCVWGLDLPHVNLELRRTNTELATLLVSSIDDSALARKVLITNPERLYGFSPIGRITQTGDSSNGATES